MAASPRVGIVILNYNGWQDTLACLKSLESLNYDNYRLLVVDNGSQNDSVQRIQDSSSVELLATGNNFGFAGGNNRGIEHLAAESFDYFWLLNNDTLVDPFALQAMVDLAESDKGLGAVGSVLHSMENPAQIVTWGGGRVWLRIGHQRMNRAPHERLDYLTGASLLIRRQAMDQIGLLDETFFFLWEDVDYSLRLTSAGWRIAVAADSHVQHKEGGSSAAYSPFRMEQHARGLVILLRKHTAWPWLHSLPVWAYYALVSLRTRNVAMLKDVRRGRVSGFRETLL